MRRIILSLLLFVLPLSAAQVATIYCDLEVEEQVLLDLIDSPAMQRLKRIQQYGVVAYMGDCEDYTRYEHSLGVWALLRTQDCSLEEQIAGLLHDVSHTAFSHQGDYLFDYFSDDLSYQDSIHAWYLEQSGVGEILRKHGFEVGEVLAKSGEFHALYQSLPDLAADRADYNIQGAYLHGNLSKAEMLALFADIEYQDRVWSLSDIELAKRLGDFSLEMSLYCWSGAEQGYANACLSQALRAGIASGELSFDDVHFGVDEELWQKMSASSSPEVQHWLLQIRHAYDTVELCAVDDAEMRIYMKCRGIDPWIRQESGELSRLSELSVDYRAALEETRALCREGWHIRIREKV